MTFEEKHALAIQACRARMGIIESTHSAKAGHPGGSLSAVEMMTYLYHKEMRVDPKNPKWEERDRFVLSKGHVAPALYSVLALCGFFPVEDLKTLRHIDSYLQGHPSMTAVPGVDMSTGSLGQGISAAMGMALGAKRRGLDGVRVYTMLGDGEMAEGEVWEALMFASHYGLTNVCVIVDLNGLQISGKTNEVMNIEPLQEKLEAFGFHAVQIDGHNYDEIEKAVQECNAVTDRPTAILMHTVKGKGVSFMENNAGWHGKAPNDEQYEQAMAELRTELARLEAETNE